MKYFNNIYQNKKVFITGHTGFKGSWLMKWLEILGAEVTGYALAPDTTPNHYSILNSESKSVLANLNEKQKLVEELSAANPDIVFHLAAQPLVRYSYKHPVETYETNVIGTMNLLEACRTVDSVKAIVCVTTDKVYQNNESQEGYKETDPLGGHDPYSSSKACAEILIQSYSSSFFTFSECKNEHNKLVASARGGNVIGGGDWAQDRLVPDIIRSVNNNSDIEIRNPNSVRPWQHVLDCLSGYLLLGQNLLMQNNSFSGPWNFGPMNGSVFEVKEILNIAQKEWPSLNIVSQKSDLHETGTLKLDCSKANNLMNWKPILNDSEMFNWTFNWYKNFEKGILMTEKQIHDYCELASQQKAIWTDDN